MRSIRYSSISDCCSSESVASCSRWRWLAAICRPISLYSSQAIRKAWGESSPITCSSRFWAYVFFLVFFFAVLVHLLRCLAHKSYYIVSDRVSRLLKCDEVLGRALCAGGEEVLHVGELLGDGRPLWYGPPDGRAPGARRDPEETSMNHLLPAFSQSFAITGSFGGGKGTLSTITKLRASPATSTPSPSERVPTSTAPGVSLSHLIREEVDSSPWNLTGSEAGATSPGKDSLKRCTALQVARSIKALPPDNLQSSAARSTAPPGTRPA
jgi:hypothetical protein